MPSRVEHETKQANSFKVFGTVANLDTTAQTFSVSDLKVKYSTARFEDFTMAELANGQAVKVKAQQYDSATNSIVATVVDLQKSTPATSEKVWDGRHSLGLPTRCVFGTERPNLYADGRY